MYMVNRKNAYKIVRYYKDKDEYKLRASWGTEIRVSGQKLEANGYYKVKNKPRYF